MDATEFMFYVFMLLGYILFLAFSIVPAMMGKKFNADDYALQVFTPSFLATFFLGIAFLGLYWDTGDEFKMSLMIITTVVGAMGISLAAIMMSMNRIRWASSNPN
jgi:hypothetical protein